MNNFQVKNIISNLDKNKDLPYSEINDVTLKANQIIYTSVNHTFRKMVDNDLFNEKKIISGVNNDNGPKISNDYQIKYAPVGYKVWDPNLSVSTSNLEIFKKYDKTVQETLTGVEITNGEKINFIQLTPYGYVVGSDNGLFIEQNGEWKIIDILEKVEGELNSGMCITTDDQYFYFSTNKNIRRTNFILTDDNQLSTEIILDKPAKTIDFFKNHLYYVDEEGIHYQIAGGYGIDYSFSGETTRVITHNDDYQLLGNADSVRINQNCFKFNLEDVSIKSKVNSIHVIDSKTYVCTDDGLYRVDGSTASKLDASSDKPGKVNTTCKFEGTIYVGADGLWKLNGDEIEKVLSEPFTKERVLGMMIIGDFLVGTTPSGIFYWNTSFSDGAKQIDDSVFTSCGQDSGRFIAATQAKSGANSKLMEFTKSQAKEDRFTKVFANVDGEVKFMTDSYIGTSTGLYYFNLSNSTQILTGDVSDLKTTSDGHTYCICDSKFYGFSTTWPILYKNITSVSKFSVRGKNIFITQGHTILMYDENKLFDDTSVSLTDMISLSLGSDSETITDIAYTPSNIYCVINRKLKLVKNTQEYQTEDWQKDISFLSGHDIYGVNDGDGNTFTLYSCGDKGLSAIQLTSNTMGKIRELESCKVARITNSKNSQIVDFGVSLQDLSAIRHFGDKSVMRYTYLMNTNDTNSKIYLLKQKEIFNLSDENYVEPCSFSDFENKKNLKFAMCDMVFGSNYETQFLCDNEGNTLKYGLYADTNDVYGLLLNKTIANGLYQTGLTSMYQLPIDMVAFNKYFTGGTELSNDEKSVKSYHSSHNELYFGASKTYSLLGTDGKVVVNKNTPKLTELGSALNVQNLVECFSDNLNTATNKQYSYDIFLVGSTNVKKFRYNTKRTDSDLNPLNHQYDENTIIYGSGTNITNFFHSNNLYFVVDSSKMQYAYVVSGSPTWRTPSNWIGEEFDVIAIVNNTGYFSKDSKLYKADNISSHLNDDAPDRLTIKNVKYTKCRHYKHTTDEEPEDFAVFYTPSTKNIYITLDDPSITLPDNIKDIVVNECRYSYQPCIQILLTNNKVVLLRYENGNWVKYEFEESFSGFDVFSVNLDFLVVGQGLIRVQKSNGLIQYSANYSYTKKVKNGLDGINTLRTVEINSSNDQKCVAVVACTNNGLAHSILTIDKSNPSMFGGVSEIKFDKGILNGEHVVDVYVSDKSKMCVLVKQTPIYKQYEIDLNNINSFETDEYGLRTKFKEPQLFYDIVTNDTIKQLYYYKQVGLSEHFLTYLSENSKRLCKFVIVDKLVEKTVPSMTGMNVNYIDNAYDVCFVSNTEGLSVLSENGNTFEMKKLTTKQISNVKWSDYRNKYLLCNSDTGLKTCDISYTTVEDVPELAEHKVYTTGGNNWYGFADGLYKFESGYVPIVTKIAEAETDMNITRLRFDNGHIQAQTGGGIYDITLRSNLADSTYKSVTYNGESVTDQFDSGKFVKMSDEKLIYTVLDKSVTDIPGKINYIGNEIINVYIGTNSYSSYKIKNYGENPKFIKLCDANNVNVIEHDSKNQFMLGTDDGLSILNIINKGQSSHITGTEISSKVFSIQGNTFSTDRFTNDEIYQYEVALSDRIVQSSQKNGPYSTILSGIYNVTCQKTRDKKDFLIGTANGLSSTSYQYVMKTDVQSEEFSEMDEKVNSDYLNRISSHVDQYHNTNSVMTYINKSVMPVDFSEIADTWNYDLVENIEFTGVLPYIKAEVINEDGTVTQLQNPQYIAKIYRKGNVEIFVNIPSTGTNYIPHIDGVNRCLYVNQSISHKNDGNEFIGNVASCSKLIRLIIDRVHFDNMFVYSVDVNGSSLPLKMYKDTTYQCNGAEQTFHSMILPSIFVGINQESTTTEIMIRCFGTDEQSVRICAYIDNNVGLGDMYDNIFGTEDGSVIGCSY